LYYFKIINIENFLHANHQGWASQQANAPSTTTATEEITNQLLLDLCMSSLGRIGNECQAKVRGAFSWGLKGEAFTRKRRPSVPRLREEGRKKPLALNRDAKSRCFVNQRVNLYVPHCSRKMMIALKDTRNYIGSGQSPTSSLRERSSVCSSVECSEVHTMGYARRVEEVGEWRGTAQMKSRQSVPLEGCLGYPYIESGARLHAKR